MEMSEAVEEMLANAVQLTAESTVDETENLTGAVDCRFAQSQVDGFAWI